MSRPYWQARHIGSMALLPSHLVKGRAYFVDDEQVLVIDHGYGPVTYGGKPGPQGMAGEPIPQLQDQINDLAEAEILTQITLWEHFQKVQVNDQHINKLLDETKARLQDQVDQNAQAVLLLIDLLNSKLNEYDNAIAILAKTVANLYPPQTAAELPQDPLDGETLTTDAGTWTIQQTYLDDGTILLELEAQKLLIDTLRTGDHVGYDGSEWTVVDYASKDGIITLTLEP